jgi:hypothetical protein
MTVTTAQGRTINIHFMHSSPDFVTREGASTVREALDDAARDCGRRLTTCDVSEARYSGGSGQETEVDYNLLGSGTAICHPHQEGGFNKARGRKTSLEYALLCAWPSKDIDPTLSDEEAIQNKQERESVWKAYLLATIKPGRSRPSPNSLEACG